MWNISSGAADFLFSLSNVVLVVGAAAVLIGTIGSIKMGAVREYFSDIRISDNERETSKANVRAAGLEKEAANARLETEKLKGVVAWRTISAKQGDELINTWSLKPGSVNLYWQDGDPEALFFAIQLSNVLQRSHWNVVALAMKPNNGILFELIVPPVAGTDADSLRSGLVTAKIPFSAVHPAAIQTGFMSSGSGVGNSNAPLLIVGSRKPVIP
jgi:hypothetical protein